MFAAGLGRIRHRRPRKNGGTDRAVILRSRHLNQVVRLSLTFVVFVIPLLADLSRDPPLS